LERVWRVEEREFGEKERRERRDNGRSHFGP